MLNKLIVLIVLAIFTLSFIGYGGNNSTSSIKYENNYVGKDAISLDVWSLQQEVDEPFENILISERKELSFIVNNPVIFNVTSPEFSIYQAIITDKENEDDIIVKIESLKDTSKLVNKSAPGIIYKNENLFIKSSRIKEIKIKFRVSEDWMKDNNVSEDRINLYRWDTTDWIQTEIYHTQNDTIYMYFDANVNGSKFAISGKPEIKTNSVETNVTPTETNVTPTETVNIEENVSVIDTPSYGNGELIKTIDINPILAPLNILKNIINIIEASFVFFIILIIFRIRGI